MAAELARDRTRELAEDDGMSTSLYTPDEALAEQTFLHDAFVKLRRRNGGAAEHGVRLAAMMDLVLEQMQQ